MKCAPRPPVIVARDALATAQALDTHRAGFTPVWLAARGGGDAGLALNTIFARFLEIQGNGLNAMPQRLQLEFLESLGANVLSPQPARAPLVFKLLDTASSDATVAQGTRVGAVLPPPAPSMASDVTPPATVAPEFFTESEFTAMRGTLAALYSIDPQGDIYADHGADATTGFSVFEAMVPVPHRLYLGHGKMFKLSGSAQIVLSFDFATSRAAGDAAQRPLLIDWEYLSNDDWQPLTLVEDGTERFTRDGKITLAKLFGPDSKQDSVGGHSSNWIRGTVSSRTPGARIDAAAAGFPVSFKEPAPAARVSVDPPGFWMHIAALPGVLFPAVGSNVKVAGTAVTLTVLDIDITRTRLVVDKAVPGATADAFIIDPSGVALAQIQAGLYAVDTVTISDPPGPGGATLSANVLGQSAGELTLDRLLDTARAGNAITTTRGDRGCVVADASSWFRLPVESTRDILPGDVITLDGSVRATVVRTNHSALFLSAVVSGAQPGLTVELADALPPLRPDGSDAAGALPEVDVIRARVGFGKADLPLDSAYVDTASLDISKDFYPFGDRPTRFATFYASCKEAFTRPGANVELAFRFNEAGTAAGNVTMSAEFFNGSRWQPLGPADDFVDSTQALTHPQAGDAGFPDGKLTFTVPAGWADTEVNGEKGRWLRLRLTSGNFGVDATINVEEQPAGSGKWVVVSTPSTLQPPIVGHLGVNYYFFTNPQSPDFCVTENEFAFAEHSDDARWPRRGFAPFAPVSDTTPALHLGFSNKPPAALISLLVQIAVPTADGDPQSYDWDYWGERGWTELSVRDTTLGLRQTGLIQFVGAPDALPREGLGGALYRIRARLKISLLSQNQIVGVGGVWLNAVWGRQGQAISRDGLGTSNGNPDQSFALPIVRSMKAAPVTPVGADGTDAVALNAADFQRALDTPLAGVPILDDEVLEIREWSGRGDDWQTVLAGVPASDVRFEVDPQDPTVVTATWVRWHAQPHFYLSGPDDRHYVVERARGVFRFPGSGGFVPPAGSPIVVSYVTGGGVDGNVPVGAVRELRSGVGFVQSVSNPVAASGGAAAELLRGARDRSAQAVRNRDRAVSSEDYEWLALAASAEVARARALPLEGPQGRGARGFVGIVLVPHSAEAQPFASAELQRTVLGALAARAPAGIAGGLHIVQPSYVAVGVRADILALRAQDAGRVEALVRTRLLAFLHPLSGGRDGQGWAFGESVFLSDLAALIEGTDGVDAVSFLQLMVGQSVYGDSVAVEPGQLVAAGDSQLKIIVPSAPYALA